MGRRVLITGLDTFWGGRMAQALESNPDIDVLVGLGTSEPKVRLERTEFVRTDQVYSVLTRLVRATQVDTIVHLFLVTDSTQMSRRKLHEVNVIGSMNLFAACGSAGSSIRHVIVKSSTLVYGSSAYDPTWFREETPHSRPARSYVERSLIEVETFVRDFAEDNPHTLVTVLRFANVLGTDIATPMTFNLSRPLVPSIAGFDPLVQFVEEDDVIRSLEFVTRNEVPGLYNVAGDGRVPWSEVAAMCDRKLLGLPPFATRAAAAGLVRLGLIMFPPEMDSLLRFGRGVDTRRIKEAGFNFRYTTAGAVENFVQALRLRRTVGTSEPHYQYESDVESFFRHSPAVIRPSDR